MSSALAANEILLGIDLGTTNTCAFFVCNAQPNPQAVVFDNGSHLLPSCVWYKPDNSVLVGLLAKKNAGNSNRYIVTNSKRVLGQRTTKKNVQAFANNCGCVMDSIDDKPVFVVSKEKRMVTPSDVAADILRKVKERAEAYSEKSIKRVMITFPAHFDNNQRTATLLAAKKAGFKQEQIKLMNEPTAASYCYSPNTNKRLQNILIYDLGGGTFDVSVLQIENNKYKILAYAGDNNLGGADFDTAIANDLELLYEETYHKSLFEDLDEEAIAKLRRRIVQTAENTKISLSARESCDVELDFLSVLNDGDGSDDDDCEKSLVYTRSRMESVLIPYITRTMETIDNALHKASLGIHQIDRVLLVGGSSRLPLVKKTIIDKFGSDLISAQVNCDESVAHGACLALFTNISRFERITYSLGQHIFYNEEMVECIIPRGSVIPIKCTLESQTSTAFTPSVYCAVSQGSSDRQGLYEPVNSCILLDQYCIDNLSPLPVVTIATTFLIDEIGMIHVTEVEKETGRTLVSDRVISWVEPNINKS